jgi:hypothetical protein
MLISAYFYSLHLLFYMKLFINVIGASTFIQKTCLCMYKKNNLNFNNLGYQTSSSRLYNLN